MKSAFQELNQINGQVNGIYHEAAVKMGLSDSEFWIFYVLRTNEEGCLQTVLCRETGMTKSTVNSALKKMEKEGLLYLTPGGGRNTCVYLTEKGKALTETTVCRLIELENQIYESWTAEEQALLLRLNRDFAGKVAEMVKAL